MIRRRGSTRAERAAGATDEERERPAGGFVPAGDQAAGSTRTDAIVTATLGAVLLVGLVVALGLMPFVASWW